MDQDNVNPDVEERMADWLMRDEVEAQEVPLDEEPEEDTSEQVESMETEEPEEGLTEEEIEELIAIRHNGEDHKLKRSEVVELAQKGYDYTRKTQEVAEQRKAFEAERQAFETQRQFNQQYLHQVGAFNHLSQQLQQYKNVNWTKLYEEDPDAYHMHKATHDQIKDQHKSLGDGLNQAYQRLQAETQQTIRQKLTKANELLKSEVKGWSEDMRNDLRAYAADQGMTDEDIQGVMSPAVVKMMLKAKQFDDLQKKGVKEKQIKDLPKVAKPGAKQSKGAVESDKWKNKRDAFRKSGGKNMDLAQELAMKFV